MTLGISVQYCSKVFSNRPLGSFFPFCPYSSHAARYTLSPPFFAPPLLSHPLITASAAAQRAKRCRQSPLLSYSPERICMCEHTRIYSLMLIMSVALIFFFFFPGKEKEVGDYYYYSGCSSPEERTSFPLSPFFFSLGLIDWKLSFSPLFSLLFFREWKRRQCHIFRPSIW